MATPKKRTGTKKATSTAEWKTSAQGHELEVPSGNTALVRRIGLQAFVQQGVIPNSLLPMVQEAMKSGTLDVKKQLGDVTIDHVQDMIKLFDAVALKAVVQPKLTAVPTDEHGEEIPLDDRDDSVLYVDEVDFEDKVFIFQWVVGGTADVEQFRKEQDEVMGGLRGGEALQQNPERSAANT